MIFNYIVTSEDDGKTIYHILIKRLNLSRKLITRLKTSDSGIMLDGRKVYTNYTVREGNDVAVNISFSEASENIEPEKIPLDVLYEDEFLIALNKPAHTVIHPTHNYRSGTLSNALVYYFNENNIKSKIRPISRLDRGTSGIVIFAKNQFVQEQLSGKSSDLPFKKKYLTLVNGIFQPEEGQIELPISRVPGSTIERTISPDGKSALSVYKTVEKYDGINGIFSLTEFELKTGRTHQIRVHCKYSGHPIVGDTLYDLPQFKNNLGMEHQALHSYKVSFIHPTNLKHIEITSPMPKDMSDAVNLVRV